MDTKLGTSHDTSFGYPVEWVLDVAAQMRNSKFDCITLERVLWLLKFSLLKKYFARLSSAKVNKREDGRRLRVEDWKKVFVSTEIFHCDRNQ